MRILIAYASKTGTAAECADIMREELCGADVTVVDLARESPDPCGYDVVVIGSSVRYGKLRREAAAYLTGQHDAIAEIPHGFYLCCGTGHAFEEYRDRLLPEDLCDSAFAVLNFGGRLKLKKAGLFERILLHAVRSHIRESEMEMGEYSPTLPDILPENISRMASAARSAYGQTKSRQNI